MTDPDGLTEEQRVLVNAAHQAIVVSAGLAAVAHVHRADDEFDQEQDVGHDVSEAHRRSQSALAAADAAGVPREVLENAVKSAMVTGRERAGA